MDEFDKSKIEALKADYSLFHPTITQIQIIYDLCDQMSKRINLEPFIIRQLFIKGIVRHQQEAGLFHMDIEQNLPQIRLKWSTIVIDKIYEEFIKILSSPDVRMTEIIKQELDLILRVYIDSYANRDIAGAP